LSSFGSQARSSWNKIRSSISSFTINSTKMLGSTSRALAMPTTALRSRGLATDSSPRKIVLVGAGFLASYIARALIADPRNRVLLVSRNPKPSTSSPLPHSVSSRSLPSRYHLLSLPLLSSSYRSAANKQCTTNYPTWVPKSSHPNQQISPMRPL
jgi:hypothetical protein